jgi:hypothetical protein
VGGAGGRRGFLNSNEDLLKKNVKYTHTLKNANRFDRSIQIFNTNPHVLKAITKAAAIG